MLKRTKVFLTFCAVMVLCVCVSLTLGTQRGVAASNALVRVTAPETVRVGQPFLLEIRSNVKLSGVTVLWRGSTIQLASHKGSSRTLLGVPNNDSLAGTTEQITLLIRYNQKSVKIQRNVKLVHGDYECESLKVAPRMVTPPKSTEKRILSERKAVRKALRTRTPQTQVFSRQPVRPVNGIVTSRYGKHRVYNGVKKGTHGGLDLRAAVGTRVKAAASGTVVLTGQHYYTGGSVYIDHGAGVLTAYCHLSKICVKKGDQVKAGDIIALAGATGRVTGPHLHLGLYSNSVALDPSPMIGVTQWPKPLETLHRL